MGVASIAVTGWRTSSRKSSQFEAELAGMAQNLKEKEAQLQEQDLRRYAICSGIGSDTPNRKNKLLEPERVSLNSSRD